MKSKFKMFLIIHVVLCISNVYSIDGIKIDHDQVNFNIKLMDGHEEIDDYKYLRTTMGVIEKQFPVDSIERKEKIFEYYRSLFIENSTTEEILKNIDIGFENNSGGIIYTGIKFSCVFDFESFFYGRIIETNYNNLIGRYLKISIGRFKDLELIIGNIDEIYIAEDEVERNTKLCNFKDNIGYIIIKKDRSYINPEILLSDNKIENNYSVFFDRFINYYSFIDLRFDSFSILDFEINKDKNAYYDLINDNPLAKPINIENIKIEESFGKISDQSELFLGDHIIIEDKTEVYSPCEGKIIKIFSEFPGMLDYIVIQNKKGIKVILGNMGVIYKDVDDYIEIGDLIGIAGTKEVPNRLYLHLGIMIDDYYINPNLIYNM